MNDRQASRRRSPPLVIWAALGLLVLASATAVALGFLAWQETQRVVDLEAQVQTLQVERQSSEQQLSALQSTAKAMENRLLTLESNDPAQKLAQLQEKLETVDDAQEVADLRASLTSIQQQVNGFQTTVDTLALKIQALETSPDQNPGESVPAIARIDITPQRQSHSLSCESSASAMVAQYHGVNLTEAEALASLPLNDNPHLGFRGNVDGPTGGIQDYGVYAGPIIDLLQSQGLLAWQVEGGLSAIKAAVARGNPVIAWVTYDCLPSTPQETVIDDQSVILVPNQHVVVITGYNDTGVWANDPWDGQEEFYAYPDLERAMGYFGNMAIEVAAP
ncbi:MAG: C39 family peptidase [Anaerolineae bacterium]